MQTYLCLNRIKRECFKTAMKNIDNCSTDVHFIDLFAYTYNVKFLKPGKKFDSFVLHNKM